MRLWITCALAAAGLVGADDPQRIRLTVERQDASGWHEVNSALVFASGDRLRFRVGSNFPGYLYAMNHGTTGGYELLFPRSDTGSGNRMEASKDYLVPASDGWFKVSGPPGHDVIYWVVSPIELGRQYRPLPPPPSKSDLPPSFHPRCDDTIFKSRGDCIDTSAGVKPIKPGEKLPDNLNGVASPTPRELLFMQEKGGVVLSSPAPLSAPVVYELRLAHQ